MRFCLKAWSKAEGEPHLKCLWGLRPYSGVSWLKGSVKNNLVEFAPKFAVDLIDLIEQNRRNSELFRGLLRMKIG